MTLLLALILAILACFAIEATTREEAAPRDLAPTTCLARAAVYGLIFAFWFEFSWRPWLAALSTVLTLVVMAVVNRLKKRVIGEPLVFSDFALLRQVPRYPELYYTRSLADPRMFVPLLLALAAVVAWYALEPTALPASPAAALACIVALPLALIGLFLTADRETQLAQALAAFAPRPDLRRDVGRWGLAPVLALYALRWRQERREPRMEAPVPRPLPHPEAPRSGLEGGLQPPRRSLEPSFEARRFRAPQDEGPGRNGLPGPPPVIVVAQLESFLDPTRLGDAPLPMLERVRARAWQYGRLRVPAHGAYTMRTEHAVLTGREEDELGFARFDPYLSLRGRLPDALPRLAARAGFASVFVHPFAQNFFNRAEIVRAMGFERLVMEDAFADAPRRGRYVADSALAEQILVEARGAEEPLLVFTVTMENHGPWRAGRLPDIDAPLDQYLHHIRNTGAAVEALLDGLAGRPGFLCLYGDHAPSLAACPPGFGDRSTDYAVVPFDPAPGGHPREETLTAAGLGRLLGDLVADAGRGVGAAERHGVASQS